MSSLQALHKRWRVFRFYVTKPRYLIWWLRNTLWPELLLPARLKSGSLWLAANDFVGKHVFLGEYFEDAEQQFLARYLQERMVVLDIGAHHGLYTLMASKKVGDEGRVIAFEPSPRELKRLRLHLRLNNCINVKVVPLALGAGVSEAELYVSVENAGSGFNSLRPPATSDVMAPLKVSVQTLDGFLAENNIYCDRVNVLKMDVEGGELDVLRGAKSLLSSPQRPLIMCEVEDVRTRPWGYDAVNIYQFLVERGFSWFAVSHHGDLEAVNEKFPQGNLIAVPEESLFSIKPFLKS
jgi:FkbM family methyltransferase